MEARLEDEEARLAPQVQVAYHVDGVLVLVGGRLFVAAKFAAAEVRQRKLHLEAVSVARSLIAQQLDPGRQVQLHFDFDLSHPWPPWLPALRRVSGVANMPTPAQFLPNIPPPTLATNADTGKWQRGTARSPDRPQDACRKAVRSIDHPCDTSAYLLAGGVNTPRFTWLRAIQPVESGGGLGVI